MPEINSMFNMFEDGPYYYMYIISKVNIQKTTLPPFPQMIVSQFIDSVYNVIQSNEPMIVTVASKDSVDTWKSENKIVYRTISFFNKHAEEDGDMKDLNVIELIQNIEN